MADKANHKNQFNAEDIERYHSGQMSVQEMHQLEKAALDDPFLADALEGYAYTKTPQADLQEIQERLNKKQEEKKTIPITSRFLWLKIAASVLAVVAAGWLLYQTTNRSGKDIALQQKVSKKEAASTPSQIENNTLSTDSTLKENVATTANADKIIESQPSKVNTELTDNKKQQQTAQDLVVADNNKKESNNKRQAQEVTDIATATNNRNEAERKRSAEPKRVDAITVDTNYFRNNVGYNRDIASGPSQARASFFNGRVVDNYNRAVRNATVVAANNVSVKTDKRGLFTLPAQDSVLNAMVNAKGFQPNQARLNVDEPITIILQPLPNALQEQVVTLSKDKVDSNIYARRQKLVADTLEPELGWTAFDDYVASNLTEKNEDLVKTNEGEVELSFEVNSKGEPVNIKVVKSLCEKCDEEAIRLLKDGPKWKRKKNNKKGRVTIKF